MAAAILGKTEVGVNEFGRDVEVPENPIAKLMYYFDSICYAMDMDRQASPDKIKKLRNYSRYRQLTDEERDLLLLLCVRFSPDELINKCLFLDEEMCGNDINKFYKLGAVRHRFLITEEIIIGGQTTHVKQILCFRKMWLEYCYLEPMKNVEKELRSIAGKLTGKPQTGTNSGPQTVAVQQRRPQSGANRGQQAGAIQQRRPRPDDAGQQQGRQQRAQPTPAPSPPQEEKKKDCVVM